MQKVLFLFDRNANFASNGRTFPIIERFLQIRPFCKKAIFWFVFAVVEGDQKPYFAQDMKGAAMQSQDLPEWKKATFGGKGGSYGKKTNLSILEQRHGLPIFKLRNELVKVSCCSS